MSNQNHIAIASRTVTVSFTFADKPGEERRKAMKEAGYKYDNGNWYRSETTKHFASEEQVANLLNAK